MNIRRVIAVLMGALLAAFLLAVAASAELHTVTVTILVGDPAAGNGTGQKLVKADVPACSVLQPLNPSSGPTPQEGPLGLEGKPVVDADGKPIVGIIGVAECPTPDTTLPTPPPPASDQPAAPVPDQPGGIEPGGQGPPGSVQKPTGHKQRKHTDGNPRSGHEGAAKGNGGKGTPSPRNPTLSVSDLPAQPRVGVPNFFIEKFRIPPFLLPIYQAAGIQYGIRWEVLAAINEIETDYGRNLSVSSAGALGWMQFMPPSWKSYGVDANGDGKKDPYNPVDAIFAAARYLKAAGGDRPGGLRRAIFAYNHADWYVDSVMLRARVVAGLPADLVGSLTGLTEGRFPVWAKARYAENLKLRRRGRGESATRVVASKAGRRFIDIFARAGSPVIAAQDGEVTKLGRDPQRGTYLVLRDPYGNRYTYSHLGALARSYVYPKAAELGSGERQGGQIDVSHANDRPSRARRDPRPRGAASAGRQPGTRAASARPKRTRRAATATDVPSAGAGLPVRERLYANPGRPRVKARAFAYGQAARGPNAKLPGWTTFSATYARALRLKRSEVVVKALRPGAKVVAGTTLGTVGNSGPDQTLAPHLRFALRPAGKGSPQIDPKPLLDGWKLLEATSIYRARGQNPLTGRGARASIGQVFLMSKPQLERAVLQDPRIELYPCGRQDVRAGTVNRRALVMLAYLASSGLRPTVSSLKCGHSYLTASGNVSEHSSGNAVDISAVNGTPIYGHQGKGSITEITLRRLLQLQGQYTPHQLISLMDLGGQTMVLADHDDHIHVGFQPTASDRALGRAYRSLLGPRQWDRLVQRLGDITNPIVPTTPSKYALPAKKPSH